MPHRPNLDGGDTLRDRLRQNRNGDQDDDTTATSGTGTTETRDRLRAPTSTDTATVSETVSTGGGGDRDQLDAPTSPTDTPKPSVESQTGGGGTGSRGGVRPPAQPPDTSQAPTPTGLAPDRTGLRFESAAAGRAAEQGFETQVPGDGDQGIETGTGDVARQAQVLEQDVLSQIDALDDPEQVRIVREGDTLKAELTQAGEISLAGDFEQSVIANSDLVDDPSDVKISLEDGQLVATLTESGRRQARRQRLETIEGLQEQPENRIRGSVGDRLESLVMGRRGDQPGTGELTATQGESALGPRDRVPVVSDTLGFVEPQPRERMGPREERFGDIPVRFPTLADQDSGLEQRAQSAAAGTIGRFLGVPLTGRTAATAVEAGADRAGVGGERFETVLRGAGGRYSSFIQEHRGLGGDLLTGATAFQFTGLTPQTGGRLADAVASEVQEETDVPAREKLDTISENFFVGTVEMGNLPSHLVGIKEGAEFGVEAAEESAAGRGGEFSRRAEKAGAAAFESFREEATENPFAVSAQLSGSLVGSVVVMGGAARLGSGAGRASRYAIQPGEELLTEGLTATAGRTSLGRRLLSKFPNERIDQEEIVLRETGRAMGGAKARFEMGKQLATGRRGLSPTPMQSELLERFRPGGPTGELTSEFEAGESTVVGARSEPLGTREIDTFGDPDKWFGVEAKAKEQGPLAEADVTGEVQDQERTVPLREEIGAAGGVREYLDVRFDDRDIPGTEFFGDTRAQAQVPRGRAREGDLEGAFSPELDVETAREQELGQVQYELRKFAEEEFGVRRSQFEDFGTEAETGTEFDLERTRSPEVLLEQESELDRRQAAEASLVEETGELGMAGLALTQETDLASRTRTGQRSRLATLESPLLDLGTEQELRRRVDQELGVETEGELESFLESGFEGRFEFEFEAETAFEGEGETELEGEEPKRRRERPFDDFGLAGGAGVERADVLHPGWFSETVAAIATFGRGGAREPTQAELEAAADDVALGEFPTGEMIHGSPETKERIEAVEDLFGGLEGIEGFDVDLEMGVGGGDGDGGLRL